MTEDTEKSGSTTQREYNTSRPWNEFVVFGITGVVISTILIQPFPVDVGSRQVLGFYPMQSIMDALHLSVAVLGVISLVSAVLGLFLNLAGWYDG